MLRLLIARHGQSTGDTERLIEGSADLSLTATGRLDVPHIPDPEPERVRAAVETWKGVGGW